MNPSNAIRILAACGVALVGPMTPDALAFARAVDIGSRKALLLFAQENPQSTFAERARKLSEDVAAPPSTQNVAFVPGSPDAWLKKNQNKMMKLVRGSNSPGHDSPGHDPSGHDPSSGPSTKAKLSQKAAIQQQVVSQISNSLSQYTRDTERCRGKDFKTTRSCVADALDKFSRGLDAIPRTPGGVTPVAVPTLRETASRIRAAKSKREARAAVAAAVPVIRKSINLIMAGDEDSTYRLQVRQRSLVVKSLTIADDLLVKATGI